MSLDVFVQPTPNPNALKFIIEKNFINEGKVTYRAPFQCPDVPLALALFDLRGVDSIHFFENSLTVSKFSFEPWENLEKSIITTLENMIDSHDSNIVILDPQKEKRKDMSPEQIKIEEILDQKIRPGLQGDGGDLNVVSFENNILVIRYQGACGTCPSSTTGTLSAIKSILQEDYSPEIEVFLAPAE